MKTVLISGGTSGIGKATVLDLLNLGFCVSTFAPNAGECKVLKSELSECFDSNSFLILSGDVTQEKQMKKIVTQTIQKFKQIDILINNAGMGYFASADELNVKKFQAMINLNLVGPAILTKQVVSFMKKQKSGLIINLVSISGKRAFAKGEFYSAAKFGLMGFTEGLRAELSELGIKVCAVCPGMVQTPFFTSQEINRRKKEVWKGKVPQMLEAQDVSRTICFICLQSEHCAVWDITVMPF
ncbi:MAG: SDR family oxidoreductase [Candidatus Diapherotrites archaeon]|nr:SDR family oxidoreductase [Candidatus Diapherotrites archaeon]